MLHPFFSIIVPTYNRPEYLTTCLEALSGHDYPAGRYEVIVVDDGGDTPLADVIASSARQLDVKLLTQSNSGPAAARNKGAAEASGEFLAFLDDDCVPARDWLSQLAQCMEVVPGNLIGGYTVNGLTEDIYPSASQKLVDYLYAYYNAENADPKFFTSNNIAVSAKQFRKLGGFDTTMPLAGGEDREFCDRWLFHGYKMTFASRAVVDHCHHLNRSSFLRQHFNYGRGAWMFHQRRSRRHNQPVRLEPLSFYIDLLYHPLRDAHNGRHLLTSVLLMMSQFANAAGFVWEGLTQGRLAKSPQRFGTQALNRAP